ncbi:riboflavin kinase/FMN adenylyltransferase [Maritalea mobilis]|uniref:Riboflavin biosynthesis protein n=1 Tax=Maritalea mobilis TaxID=483324 RepID=A0A4R6VUW1_9HYPH|nr:bifunctional riboflavin kinase/FAD synthetase [Maritalea mobilis]TDQ63991.1 riboflavin kinase/FMN adenylyltransferase [Maritalea mobilis]
MAFTIVENLGQLPQHLRGGVVAIGNFDGCHRGHQSIFERAKQMAAANNVPALVLTFEPHPRDVFAPEPFMFRLTERNQKARLVEAMGFDGIVIMPFTKDFSQKSAPEFIENYIVDQLGASIVTVGADFHFGKNRAGTPQYLVEAGPKYGFDVVINHMLDEGDAPVSSTRVREALREGEVRFANQLLGYHAFIAGEVSHGDKRGRELGYPTANLHLSPHEGLKHGVYVVRARVKGKTYHGVANFGRRPMFDNGMTLFETHIFDFAQEVYGEYMEVALCEYLRGEENFNSLDELIAAMDKDSEKAKAILADEKAMSEIDVKLGFFDQ